MGDTLVAIPEVRDAEYDRIASRQETRHEWPDGIFLNSLGIAGNDGARGHDQVSSVSMVERDEAIYTSDRQAVQAVNERLGQILHPND